MSKPIDWSDDDLIDEDPPEEIDYYASEYTGCYVISEQIDPDGSLSGGPIANGHKTYYKLGTHDQHRIGGPAVIYGDKTEGSEEWWEDGLLHREDGPAKTIFRGGSKGEYTYARRGVILSKEEFETKIKPSLEAEFITAVEAVKNEFEPIHKEAEKLSNEYRTISRQLEDLKCQAQKLSEKYGIPVSADFGYEKGNYQPKSRMKYKDLDRDIMKERLKDAGTPSDDWYGFGMLQLISFSDTDRQGRNLQHGGWIESSNCKG